MNFKEDAIYKHNEPPVDLNIIAQNNGIRIIYKDIITQLANKFKVSVTAISFKIQNSGYSF